MSPATIHIKQVQTDREWHGAVAVRFAVFVDEQHVPADAELDHLDAGAVHAVALADDEGQMHIVGTGRLVSETPERARIGRVAVLPAYRGRGVGSQLLHFLEELARQCGCTETVLHAQTHAIGFYERHGYVAGDPSHIFDEDGIPHVAMYRAL